MSAISDADRAYACLQVFHHRVRQAEEVIATALARWKRPLVSFSGGKDSTVLLHLVSRQCQPLVAFYDSGAELPETTAFVRRTFDRLGDRALWVEPAQSILDIHADRGVLDWTDALSPAPPGYYKRVLIEEPARVVRETYGIDCVFLGLRAGESDQRRTRARTRGMLHVLADGSGAHVTPLAWWTDDDVWAYIAVHDLEYNACYDVYARLGLPRRQWRVAPWAGLTSLRWGRLAILKAGWPEIFARFAERFPRIKEYV